MDTPIHPNDVAVILRPDHKEGKPWNGNFEILIAGFGPVTMAEESMRELVSMAMLVAAAVPAMEGDVELTEKLTTICANIYGEADDVMISEVVDDDTVSLNENTKCVGGMQ